MRRLYPYMTRKPRTGPGLFKIQLWCSRPTGGILCCYLFHYMCILNFSADRGHDTAAWNVPRNLLIIVHNVASPHSLGNRLSWSSSRGKRTLREEGLFKVLRPDSWRLVWGVNVWGSKLVLPPSFEKWTLHPWAHHSIHSCKKFGHSYTLWTSEIWQNADVELWDPECMTLNTILDCSPRDWKTLIHFNVVLTIFHIDHISQGVWKNVRNTFQCIVFLQSRGKVLQICPKSVP